jgi:hypothetical protein
MDRRVIVKRARNGISETQCREPALWTSRKDEYDPVGSGVAESFLKPEKTYYTLALLGRL